MNINPQIWGRDTWNFFYYVALSYPKHPTQSDRTKYSQFYKLAGQIVPCEKCRFNFEKHFQELPIQSYLNSSYDLFIWITKMDNKVRVLNGGTERTVDETYEHYMTEIQGNFIGFNFNKKQKILITMAVIIVGLYIFKRLS